MPLSEYEQRVWSQLEQDLGQDASLHRAMSRGPGTPGRVIAGIVGVLVGLGIVLVGVMVQQPLVGVLGFAVMAGVALWVLLTPRRKAGQAAPSRAKAPSSGAGSTARPASEPKRTAKKQPKSQGGFMQRMEERFDRRREQGDL